ncbi:MAG: hypothetical protein HY300_12655 [Verrucomicrobia bacterium]|nr:hypothetical protein [Verrucomicrobiota bacterium]
MKSRWPGLLLILVLAASLGGQPGAAPEKSVAFRAVDVFLDSHEQPLAAYQLEFFARSGTVKIVGIEGGEHAAFKEAPFYDPLAMQQERVILAAYNTAAADKLPSGRTRVATIHLQVSGSEPPQFTVKLDTAGSAEGNRIPAEAAFAERQTK